MGGEGKRKEKENEVEKQEEEEATIQMMRGDGSKAEWLYCYYGP